MRKFYSSFFFLLLIQVIQAQTTVSIVADKDNTIYSEFPSNSNGLGEYLFAGKNAGTNAGSVQRSLLHFDLSSIPNGAVISAATLQLYANKTAPVATGLELRKLNVSWGEGTSDAASLETSGAAATPGDATWTSRLSPSTNWSVAGGDFSTTVSASIAQVRSGIATDELITLSGQNTISDVQSWISNSASNFGWILMSNNETAGASMKRFISRNSGVSAHRPTLSITYSVSLPITLSGFSASLNNQHAVLKWSTLNEINNDHFEIEHSNDGKEFLLLAKVKGSGTSASQQSYSYKHENIFSGKHFYRIADIDKSGNKRYSPIVSLMFSASNPLQLFPNPALSGITVTASSLLQGAEFTIGSLFGQTVLRGIVTNQQIDIRKLAPGQYLFSIKTRDGEILKTKFIKR